MIRPPYPSEILSRYKTDKTGGHLLNNHSYGKAFYDHYLPHYRWCERVLEVGIWYGESLKAWEEYFPDALVVGVDINRDYLINKGRIESYCLNAGNLHSFETFVSYYAGLFSVAIDDASHNIEDQIVFVTVMKKYLRKGGILIVEDISSVANGVKLQELGCRVEEYDIANRSDDRIAFWINT